MKRYATTFLLLTALCAFAFAPAPVQAQTLTKAALQARIVAENQLRHDLFYGALDASAQTGDVAGTLKILSEGLAAPLGQLPPTDVALQWLIDNTFDQPDPKKINAFYFMVLADLKTPIAVTFQATGKDALFKDSAQLALKALMTYEILAVTDAERCDDPSIAAKVIPDSIGPRYADLVFAFKALSKEQFDLLGYYATELERLKADRPINTLLCAKGDKAKADPHYKPQDLSAINWLQRRTDLRLMYKNLWSKRYYDYQKPQPIVKSGPAGATITSPQPLTSHGAVPGVPTDMPIAPADTGVPNKVAPTTPAITGPAPAITTPDTGSAMPAPLSPAISNPAINPSDATPPANVPATAAPTPVTPAADIPQSSMPAAPAPFAPMAPQTAPPPAFTPTQQ